VLHYVPLIAFSFPNVLAPIVAILHQVLGAIHHVIGNYGWSLIVLALLVKLVFWPLNAMQYKSLIATQAIQPRLKALQAKHKNDKAMLSQEQMALYKETGVNPFASCLPLVAQMPILFSLYQAISGNKDEYAKEGWLWIGTPLSHLVPSHVLATSLAVPDYVLLIAYVVSMYFTVKLTSPAVDEATAQQQRIMSFISPVMVGYMGWKFAWPSALIIYWLAFNLFGLAQQLYLMKRHPRLATAVTASATPAVVAPKAVAAKAAGNVRTGGSRNARRRSSRR